MTPERHVERVKDLVGSGDQEALDFSARIWPSVNAKLSARQLFLVSDLMYMAQMSVDFEDHPSVRTAERGGTPARA